MADGDDAAAAGMDVVAATGKVRDGYKEINKTRDYIIQKFTAWIAALWPVPIDKGGTGKTTAGEAIAALSGWKNSGAVSAGEAPTLGWIGGGHIQFAIPGYAFPTTLANLSDIGGGGSDLTLSGHLYVPNSVAASSGYTVAYINGDGRLSRGASSERYKDDIELVTPSSLGNIFPDLYSFSMKGDPGRMTRYGNIAERLNESPALQPFVVYERVTEYDDDGDITGSHLVRDENGDPIPDSIDFIALQAAQIAQLHAENVEQRSHLDQLRDAVIALSSRGV